MTVVFVTYANNSSYKKDLENYIYHDKNAMDSISPSRMLWTYNDNEP